MARWWYPGPFGSRPASVAKITHLARSQLHFRAWGKATPPPAPSHVRSTPRPSLAAGGARREPVARCAPRPCARRGGRRSPRAGESPSSLSFPLSGPLGRGQPSSRAAPWRGRQSTTEGGGPARAGAGERPRHAPPGGPAPDPSFRTAPSTPPPPPLTPRAVTGSGSASLPDSARGTTASRCGVCAAARAK